jgi:hypothetical protein
MRGRCDCDEKSDDVTPPFGSAFTGSGASATAPTSTANDIATRMREPQKSTGTLPHRTRGVNRLTVEPSAAPPYVADMTQSQHEKDEEQRREALATLDKLRDSESVVSSALARTARRASDHFAAKDAKGEDAVEVWGRRIGRGLSLAGLIGLVVYFYFTYFAKP